MQWVKSTYTVNCTVHSVLQLVDEHVLHYIRQTVMVYYNGRPMKLILYVGSAKVLLLFHIFDIPRRYLLVWHLIERKKHVFYLYSYRHNGLINNKDVFEVEFNTNSKKSTVITVIIL